MNFALRQYRTIGVCELRSKIFRQVVQKFCRLADASQGIFVQHNGNRCKGNCRLNQSAIISEKFCRRKRQKTQAILYVLTSIFGVLDGKTAAENCAMV